MKNNSIKSIMHPIRIRIIQQLNLKKQATTKEILESCGECSQATLYRHLKALLNNEVIEVVKENNVNGILEKVYALKTNAQENIIGDPTKLKKEDYLNLFTQFTMSLLYDFSSYMNREDSLSNIQNHIGFSSSSLLLTDDELQQMFKEISDIIIKYMHNEPKPGRKMRKFSQIVTTTNPKKSN